MLQMELKEIGRSESRPFHKFKLMSGVLEKLLADKKHPARKALIRQNLFFGSRTRKRVKVPQSFRATNSPLSLNPEILEEVLRYVFLPKEVVNAYRADLKTEKSG